MLCLVYFKSNSENTYVQDCEIERIRNGSVYIVRNMETKDRFIEY